MRTMFLSAVMISFLGLTACTGGGSDNKGAPKSKVGGASVTPAPIELQGDWNGNLETDQGPISVTLTIRADGSAELKEQGSNEVSKSRITLQGKTWYYVDEEVDQLLRFEFKDNTMTVHVKDDKGEEIAKFFLTKIRGPRAEAKKEPKSENQAAAQAPENLIGNWAGKIMADDGEVEVELSVKADKVILTNVATREEVVALIVQRGKTSYLKLAEEQAEARIEVTTKNGGRSMDLLMQIDGKEVKIGTLTKLFDF